MRKTPPSLALPGMVLAEAVRHRDGNLLLGEGTELTLQHLEMLEQRSVALISIALSVSSEPTTHAVGHAVNEGALKKAIVQERAWFGEARKDALMSELLRVCVHRLARGEDPIDAGP